MSFRTPVGGNDHHAKIMAVGRQLPLFVATAALVTSCILAGASTSSAARTDPVSELRAIGSTTLSQRSFVVIESVPAGESSPAFLQQFDYQAPNRTRLDPLLPCHPDSPEAQLTPVVVITNTMYFDGDCPGPATWVRGRLTSSSNRLFGPAAATAQLRYVLAATTAEKKEGGFRFRSVLDSVTVYGSGSGRVVLSGTASVRAGLIRSISLTDGGSTRLFTYSSFNRAPRVIAPAHSKPLVH